MIMQAGLVVQCVLCSLLFASIFSWAIILTKWRYLRAASRENQEFQEKFWNGKSLEDISNKVDHFKRSTLANVFRGGYKELQRLSEQDLSLTMDISPDNIMRSLLRATNTEVALLEKHLSWLATIASAAPFVGLFGTVWGIMNAFHRIGISGNANISVIAPGISEALIATAIGLAAAIPAVVGYNQFVNKIKRIATDMDSFSQDFLNILQRSFTNMKKGGT